MEFYTQINFKFDTKEKNQEIGKLFRRVYDDALKLDEIVELFKPHSEAAAKMIPSLVNNSMWESYNFMSNDGFSFTDNKVTIHNTVGTGGDEYVPVFLKFVLALNGTPLTSKVKGDECNLVFKYSKSKGITAEDKSYQDDYNHDDDIDSEYDRWGRLKDLHSMTNLLTEHGKPISAVKANKLMIKLGLLEEKERPSTSDPSTMRKYKALTAEGLKYGINESIYGIPEETTPYYIGSKFEQLLERIMAAFKDK